MLDVEGAVEKNRLDEFRSTNVALRREVESLNTRLADNSVESMVLQVASKFGVRAAALPDMTNRARQIFRMVDEELRPVQRDGKSPVLGADGTNPISFAIHNPSAGHVCRLTLTPPYAPRSMPSFAPEGNCSMPLQNFSSICKILMQMLMKRFIVLILLCAFAASFSIAQEKEKEKPKDKQPEKGEKAEKKEQSIFPDKNLEAAVRKFVFEKRDNDKPILESDVVQLSTINGVGMSIKDLTGLEKCRSLASLDLARNQISDISPLKGLANIQYLNLAGNQIADVSPLRGIAALQYIELTGNKVKDVSPLASLTNMNSLYLSSNRIAEITALFNLQKLWSLYLDGNQIENVKGIGALNRLSTLSLSHNKISDVTPLQDLNSLYHLFLEGNRIKDLTPLLNAARKDHEGDKRFVPFINIYLAGNPLSGTSKKHLATLKEYGARVHY